MSLFDWFILIIYFISLILLSVFIGRRQKASEDYFLGGKRLKSPLIGMSLAANQVSAISLIGAPAFVAMQAGGGLRWLQYELAVPLAMIFIIFIIAPLYRRLDSASVFEYLEKRFSTAVRLALSAIFLISRGLASGVVLYSTAIVLAVALGVSLHITLLLIGVIAIAYTSIGGITADIYSDAAQLLLLFAGTVIALVIAFQLVVGFEADAAGTTGESSPLALLGKGIERIDDNRLVTIDVGSHGLGDGQDYGFWPLLIGGFFLYLSYYGCDQSQAQRLMCVATTREAQKSLFINGLIRFPVVLAYGLLGILLAVYIAQHPGWTAAHNVTEPDFLVPVFIVNHLPAGLIGLVIAGIFAATMSSIDSNLNSLSAVTISDFVTRWKPELKENPQHLLWLSRMTTLAWGLFCILSSYLVTMSTRTVIELVNQIGSLFYGPVLAVFLVGALIRKARSRHVLPALAAGLFTNLYLWINVPSVSWLWWNVFGFLIGFITAVVLRYAYPPELKSKNYWTLKSISATRNIKDNWITDGKTWILLLYFGLILTALIYLGTL